MINTISNNYYVEFDILNSTQAVVNISAPSKEEINSINNLLYAGLSYFDSKSLYTWEYDEGFTDGVVYVYNKVKQTIPIGLIPRATKYLQDRKSKLKIHVSDRCCGKGDYIKVGKPSVFLPFGYKVETFDD